MLTKEMLILCIRGRGCGMLNDLKLEDMSLEQIIKHLEDCKCPELKKLLVQYK